MFWANLSVILTSSLAVLAIAYFRLPVTSLFLILSLLLFALLLLIKLFFLPVSQKILGKSATSLLLLTSSAFVQLLVLTTGGLISSLLILVHLFTLAAAFLVGLTISLVFLVSSSLVFAAHLLLDRQMGAVIYQDPGAIALSTASLIAIVPLSFILAHNYRLKDTLYRILRDYIKVQEMREESILKGLTELVVITDERLKIVYANEAVEKALNLPSPEVTGHRLLQTVPLQDKNGKALEENFFPTASVLVDKAVHILPDLYLQTKLSPKPAAVSVRIQPIADLHGKINQLMFVISQAREGERGHHLAIEQAISKRNALVEDIKKGLVLARLPDLAGRLELCTKIEEDLITALELEDHKLKEQADLEDIVRLCRQVVATRGILAGRLGVGLRFPLAVTTPLLVPVDVKWLGILLQKLLEISLFLSSHHPSSAVQLLIAVDSLGLTLTVAAPVHLSEHHKSQLFVPYYGDLGSSTNLRLGSGLEGFIAQTVAAGLNIPLAVKAEEKPARLSFVLRLKRGP